MKTIYEIASDYNIPYYNEKEDKLEHIYNQSDEGRVNNYIRVETYTELTGRWKITYNKVSGESVFETEVKYIYSWKTTKKKYTKVIEHPKVWYTKSFFFFTTKHSTGGRIELVPEEIITHTREELKWVDEDRISFYNVMEDSDYETTINECVK